MLLEICCSMRLARVKKSEKVTLKRIKKNVQQFRLWGKFYEILNNEIVDYYVQFRQFIDISLPFCEYIETVRKCLSKRDSGEWKMICVLILLSAPSVSSALELND